MREKEIEADTKTNKYYYLSFSDRHSAYNYKTNH